MLDVLGAIRGHILKLNSVVVDNYVFRLHYKMTTWLLVAFSTLVTCRQYMGDPIDCISYSSNIPSNIMDQYCWISTTFTLPHLVDQGLTVGFDIPHPGVDTSSASGTGRVYHQYYQWVCFVLFLQAIMFYAPHYLWKMWEGGRMKALACGLDLHHVSADQSKVTSLTQYLASNFGRNNFYFAKHVVCEVLNLVNVVGQIYFTDRFLGGTFVSYGAEVVRYSETNQENRTDPMVKIFPRVTKCVMQTFGPSGEVQKHDSLCVLPINIINEKIYIFLWFWFVILALLTTLAVVYRSLTILIPRFRHFLLTIQSGFASRDNVTMVHRMSNVGDWFVIYKLGQSIDDRCFAKVIDDLATNAIEKLI